jgi:Fe2+ or Zn2+ uptake regulation protein
MIGKTIRGHPVAQRIYREVKHVHPKVSLATVYKALHALKELSLVQEQGFAESETKLDSYMEPYANLVCRACGNISDVDDPVTREIVARVAAKARFTLMGQLCPSAADNRVEDPESPMDVCIRAKPDKQIQ